jgi:endonuclease YncB( thermonuclease family)
MKNILIICLIVVSSVLAAEKLYGDATNVKVISIYDGDTFKCSIKDYPAIIGENVGIRIFGIDCPEMTDKRLNIKALAQQAKQYTVARLRAGKVISLLNMRRDKYFRIVADVTVDGKDLANELIDKGLAKPYGGGTKKAW